MSTIEDKIKLLQKKLVTIEKLKEILGYVEKMQDSEGHEGIVAELNGLFKQFVELQIGKLEQGEELQTVSGDKKVTIGFSEEDMTILRSLVGRVKNQNNPNQSPPTHTTPVRNDKSDKIRFAMNNRHLDQKRVAVETKDGTVKGKVVGLDAPHVIVQTDTGYTVPFELEQVTVLS